MTLQGKIQPARRTLRAEGSYQKVADFTPDPTQTSHFPVQQVLQYCLIIALRGKARIKTEAGFSHKRQPALFSSWPAVERTSAS